MFCTCWWPCCSSITCWRPCFVPVGGHVVAVLRQEVVADLVEEVERDAAARNIDTVVDFTEERVERDDREVLADKLVSEAVHFQKSLQLLRQH